MKKRIMAVSAVLLSIAMFTAVNAADINGVKVSINGSRLDFADQKPIVENGRTLVPMRAIFEGLGAEIEWDNVTKTVTSKKGDTVVSVKVGSGTMTVNGESVALDVPASVVNARTMVPLRAVSEAFGADVQWDALTKSVIIEAEAEESTKAEITLADTTELFTEEETETTTGQKLSSKDKHDEVEEETEETTKKSSSSNTEETTKRKRRNADAEEKSEEASKPAKTGYGTISGDTYISDGETFKITLGSNDGWTINKSATKDNKVVIVKDDETELEIFFEEGKSLDDIDIPENEDEVFSFYADMDASDIVFTSKKVSGGKKVTFCAVTDVFAQSYTYVETDKGLGWVKATLNNSDDAVELMNITDSFTGVK